MTAERAYSTRPFFQFLRDESYTARERLAFVPCMAPFVLDFGDLNAHVLRDETSTDPLQALVNRPHVRGRSPLAVVPRGRRRGSATITCGRPRTCCGRSTATAPPSTACSPAGSRTCCGTRRRRSGWSSSRRSRRPATCCSRLTAELGPGRSSATRASSCATSVTSTWRSSPATRWTATTTARWPRSSSTMPGGHGAAVSWRTCSSCSRRGSRELHAYAAATSWSTAAAF